MTKGRKRALWAGCALLLLLAAAGAALFFTGGWRVLLRQPDENGLYCYRGSWVEAPDPQEEATMDWFANKLLSLQEEYLTEENRAFWALAPDKSCYAQGSGWPALDMAAMQQGLRQRLQRMEEVDLSPALSLEDYYLTDPHWRQERLEGVVGVLGDHMGFSVDFSQFTAHSSPGFYGFYSLQSGRSLAEEELVYLTSPFTEAARVESYQVPDEPRVYHLEALSTDHPYNVFLSGASPVVAIRETGAGTGRELVIFGDSFASSLAPLLCGAYDAITILDIRYMAPQLIPEFVTFQNQDVLFLYSTSLANRRGILR